MTEVKQATESITMSVYEALRRRKVYRNQLEKMIQHKDEFRGTTFAMSIVPANDKQANGKTIDELTNLLKSAYDKRAAIIRNVEILDGAIYQSNAVTKVDISGKTYTVAEAISKYSRIQAETVFYQDVLNSVSSARATVENENRERMRDEKIASYLETKMESMSAVLKDGAEAQAIQEKFKEEYIKNNTYAVLDPYKLEDTIADKMEELVHFADAYNGAISLSNMQTLVTVDLVPTKE